MMKVIEAADGATGAAAPAPQRINHGSQSSQDLGVWGGYLLNPPQRKISPWRRHVERTRVWREIQGAMVLTALLAVGWLLWYWLG